MQRLLLLPATLSLSLLGVVLSQTISPADVAAQHRLLLENDRVRVFAVNIPVGQQTFIRHQHNFLTVALEDSQMVMWSEGASANLVFHINRGDTRFFLGGAAFGMRNDGQKEYRNVTVEFLDPRVTNYGFNYNLAGGPRWDYGSSALAPPADPRAGFVHPLPLQAAVVRDVQLLSGEQLPTLLQPAKELLIAVSDLNLTAGTNASLRRSAGEIAWLEGRTSPLINQGTVPVRFVAVEVK